MLGSWRSCSRIATKTEPVKRGHLVIEFRTQRDPAEASPQSIYERLHADGKLGQLDSYYLWALRKLGVPPGRSLLDVSCGTGRVIDLAVARGIAAFGIDIAYEAVRCASSRTCSRFVQGDAQRLPFLDESFDYVLSLGSIEHYEQPELGIAEMARVVRREGLVGILVPNAYSLLHTLYVWRHGTAFDDGQPIQRYATRREWIRMIEANDLTIIATVRHNLPIPSNAQERRWFLSRPMKLIRLLLADALPLDLADSFLFVGVKATGHKRQRGMPA